MKSLFFPLIIFILIGCNRQTHNISVMQNRIDSLEQMVSNSYKPGFGDFMGSIQIHHNKLWFAGKNQNWKLADFEIHEISEAFDDIKKYQKDRKETKTIDMINPALDSLTIAINQENPVLFRSSYILLTNTCNSCHRANDLEFNVVKIPENPPFSNQDFELSKEK